MLQVIPKIVIRSIPVGNYYQILEIDSATTVIVEEYCEGIKQAQDRYFSWKHAKSNKEYEFIYDKVCDEYVLTKKRYGYHISDIKKGTLGEASKIIEEALEFQDATQQGVSVMAILELADLMGAVEAYLEKYHPTIKLDDLIRMKDVTKRAFSNGHRN